MILKERILTNFKTRSHVILNLRSAPWVAARANAAVAASATDIIIDRMLRLMTGMMFRSDGERIVVE